MPLHEVRTDTERIDSCCILIPFHHRDDLLIPLLQHLKQFSVVVVDDGYTQSDWSHWKVAHPNLECVRTKGNSGFTHAVNCGLEHIETMGFRYVLILNDDAWLGVENITILMNNARPKRFVSPVIESKGKRFYGVRVYSWGLVRLNQSPSKQVDALLGACLLMPANLRFDTRFHHGFEDLHLTMMSRNDGFELCLLKDVVCTHIGGATLDSQSLEGLRFSVYGHLCLYDSLRKGPLIWSLYLIRVILSDETIKFRIKSFKAIHQGVFDWFCSAIAARIASSKAGSNKIR